MPRVSRIGLVHALLALFALALLGQAARVQVLNGRAWRARAERQQLADRAVPAPRGAILDATGQVLAQSREVVQLEVAPREVREREKLRRALGAIHLSPAWIARALDTSRAWVTLPGRYEAVDAAPALALRGVHPRQTILRAYAMSDATRGIVGRVDANGAAVDGLELALDPVLRGTPGRATLIRDVQGRSFESPTTPGTPPTPGQLVVLTIHHELQEIVERSLADAVSQMQADGGDIVILDPHTGEILALASERAGAGPIGAATALTEPFEPGSSMKPFIAAALLSRGRVSEHDSVDTGNGVLELNGREIHDEHPLGRVPLRDVLKWSSNVGIVKFASRLTPREEFETLRDFGFGTPTGIQFPSEAAGTLREPRRWSRQSAASLAIGYELSATPLQLAVAYAAIANGGELLEPTLVKEVRAPDGTVRYRHTPRVVRRVLEPDTANALRRMLLGVVEQGTATRADLSSFVLAGKTGTPRRTVGGRYAESQYNPNFVGIFPGDDPQYVVVVKLTNPKGTYFGGTTAAPLTKAVLEAAIASRDAALDRTKLAASAHDPAALRHPAAATAATPPVATQAGAPAPDSSAAPPAWEASLPLAPAAPAPALPPRAVPDVRGLSLRLAVQRLHSAGFHVVLGAGSAGTTTPAAGTIAPAGATVRLLTDPR